jgi:transcriptional regulator with XRE-family HTH domain
MLQICQNIKQARLSAKLSQEEMAHKLGIKRTTYQNWEKNIEPDLTTIVAIAKNLGIATTELLRGVIDLNGHEKSGAGPDYLRSVLKQEIDTIRSSLDKLSKALQVPQGLERPVGSPKKEHLDLGKKVFGQHKDKIKGK